MPTPRVTTSGDDIAAVACDALVVGAFEENDSAALHGSASPLSNALGSSLEETLRSIGFKGKRGHVAVVPTMGRSGATVIAVAGLGPKDSADASSVRHGAATAARRLSDHNDVALALHQAVDGTSAAAAEGFLLGTYSFTAHKSDPKPSKIQTISVLEASDAEVERGTVLAEATMLARDLINAPPGHLTPTTLARKAEEIADVGGLDVTVLDPKGLAERGFGGIVGVGRGSDEPYCLIQMRYTPDDPKGKVAIVGKGVTFDSGGLSIKDGRNMMDMKTDMSGAAAVMGAMSALPRLGPDVEVIAYVPAVENLPSGHSIRPGDVITHYGGRTSEVLNTDAEGRLILADAIALASEENPEAIIDVATLTGAMVVALGLKVFGAFASDDALMEELRAAADRAGEPMWQMPLVDAYKKDLESEVADCKNVAGRWGGSIFAALYLQQFVGADISWGHLDIAGPARAENPYNDISKGGSGVATRTLIHWIEGRSS
jgi:leucyl aminopeptidase